MPNSRAMSACERPLLILTFSMIVALSWFCTCCKSRAAWQLDLARETLVPLHFVVTLHGVYHSWDTFEGNCTRGNERVMCICPLLHFPSMGQSLHVQRSYRVGGEERGRSSFGTTRPYVQTCLTWMLGKSQKANHKCDLAYKFLVILYISPMGPMSKLLSTSKKLFSDYSHKYLWLDCTWTASYYSILHSCLLLNNQMYHTRCADFHFCLNLAGILFMFAKRQPWLIPICSPHYAWHAGLERACLQGSNEEHLHSILWKCTVAGVRLL